MPLKAPLCSFPSFCAFAFYQAIAETFQRPIQGLLELLCPQQSQKCSGINIVPPRDGSASDWCGSRKASCLATSLDKLLGTVYIPKLSCGPRLKLPLHGASFEVTLLLCFSSCILLLLLISSFSWEHFLNRLLTGKVPFHLLLWKTPRHLELVVVIGTRL